LINTALKYHIANDKNREEPNQHFKGTLTTRDSTDGHQRIQLEKLVLLHQKMQNLELFESTQLNEIGRGLPHLSVLTCCAYKNYLQERKPGTEES
jgi:hypothetical protein